MAFGSLVPGFTPMTPPPMADTSLGATNGIGAMGLKLMQQARQGQGLGLLGNQSVQQKPGLLQQMFPSLFPAQAQAPIGPGLSGGTPLNVMPPPINPAVSGLY